MATKRYNLYMRQGCAAWMLQLRSEIGQTVAVWLVHEVDDFVLVLGSVSIDAPDLDERKERGNETVSYDLYRNTAVFHHHGVSGMWW